jgi:hypothetical protein
MSPGHPPLVLMRSNPSTIHSPWFVVAGGISCYRHLLAGQAGGRGTWRDRRLSMCDVQRFKIIPGSPQRDLRAV